MHRPLAIRLFLFALLLLGAGGLLAAAGPDETAPPPVDDSLLSDAKHYVRLHGVDLEEAIRRLRLQPLIGRLNAQLEADYAETFGGLWIEHRPAYRVVVRFTRPKASQSALAPFQTALPDLPVEVWGAEHSLAELRSQLDDAAFTLDMAGVGADLFVDVRSNSVALATDRSASLSRALAGRELVLPTAVRLRPDLEPMRPEMTMHAGLPIIDCTLGFSVETPAGRLPRGILTAGHCPNAQTVSGTGLSFDGEMIGGSQDVQLHSSTSLTPVAWMEGDSGPRPVMGAQGRTQTAVGSLVCHFGSSSGYECGNVLSNTFRPGPSCLTRANATFVRVGRDEGGLSTGGDSGGPWMTGNLALGIHICGNSNNRSTYMPIENAGPLDVSLLIYEEVEPTCQDLCREAHRECLVENCFWNPVMCPEGCDKELAICLAGC